MGHSPLLESVRSAIRTRHYARSTEKTYLLWIRRFILHNGKRHPRDMGAPEVQRFLSHLATERKVAASTQNQALSAILFLYRHVLDIELPWLEEVTRAKRRLYVPTVLSPGEVRRLLSHMSGTAKLIAELLCGSDIRTVQALLGHADVSTTMIYTHIVKRGAGAVKSPLD